MRLKYVVLPVVVVLAVSVLASLAGPPADTGTIEGKVTYTGTPPKMKPIDMSKEPICAKEHNPPELAQNVVTGPGNALQDVVVYISADEQTSHYAVTDNNGSFSLKDLTPGKYTVTSWQEQYGTKSQEVTLAAGETKSITFTYKATPYLY